MQETRGVSWIVAGWMLLAALLIMGALLLLVTGDQFRWPRPLSDIPALWLAGGLVLAGLLYLLLVPLLQLTFQMRQKIHAILAIIVVAGLVMRVLMLTATPALEDDFYRYLWDGAVTASGLNPYAVAPSDARGISAPGVLTRLAEEGLGVLQRVNHPELKTIYPPVAQGAFAFAYLIEPLSLKAWRIVCLGGEIATLLLLLGLLTTMGRSSLFVALYWLNPLVVKELMNSAHMEAIVLPFVLGALLLLVRQRPVMASAALGLAIGAKLWPVMLLPFVLRPLIGRPWHLLTALAILGVMAIAWLLPPIIGGLDNTSGFVAYASYWRTNSAMFLLLHGGVSVVLDAIGLPNVWSGTIVRGATAVTVFGLALWLARRHPMNATEIINRAGVVIVVLFLLSPAQFPWYATWVLIFAPLMPLAGLLGVTVFLPLYYVSFYFYAIQDFNMLQPWLVWVQWVPIWLLFGFDAWRTWRWPMHADVTSTGSLDQRP